MAASLEQRLAGAAYRVFAKPALYTPPGGGVDVPCSVQVMRAGNPGRQNPFETMSFPGSSVSIAVAEIDIIVRRSELDEPAQGGRFRTFSDPDRTQLEQTFDIGQGALPYDAEGLEWRCTCTTADQ